ncbi:MAG TPA: CsbD family protein [Microbacterium sp.]|nr:CsbD family protein [Microbacterium sp.]
MSTEDKMKAAKENVEGKAKEAAGRVAHDDDLIAEGKAHQMKADAHEAKGHVKDAVDDVKDALDE